MCVLYVFSLLTAVLPSCSLAWLFSEMVNQLNALSCLAGDPEDYFLKLASKTPSSAQSPSQELISKLNFLEEDQDTPPALCSNPFEDPADDVDDPSHLEHTNHFNPFGDPDDGDTGPPSLTLRQDPVAYYVQESSNPFDEDEVNPHSHTEYNPFDDQDPDLVPDPDPQGPQVQQPEAPKPRGRKGVRPVDMSKYLYADTNAPPEDQLDESNPFYEPRTSSPSRPSGGPSPDFSNQKRRAPLPPRPPGPSPSAPNTSREGAERERFMPSGPSAVAAVVGRELAFSSPKVRLFEEGSGTRAVVFKKCVCVCSQSVCSCVCMCLRVCPVTSNLLI
eukprot:XP_014010758.1 PREDICTED: EH domain-binding protein 1-like [Salmo salar]